MTFRVYQGDLPEGLEFGDGGRDRHRDDGAQPATRPAVPGAALGAATATPIWCSSPPAATTRPTCGGCWPIPTVAKLFHFGRFDIAMLRHYLGVLAQPVYCTKIASKLVRTFTDRHGLKDLCKDLLGVELSKQQQSSDWGAANADRRAAALCRLRRPASARAAPPARRDAGARRPRPTWPGPASTSCRTARLLDLAGWAEQDIFEH